MKRIEYHSIGLLENIAVNAFLEDGTFINKYDSIHKALRRLFAGDSRKIVDKIKKNGKPRTAFSKLLNKRFYLKSR